MSADGINDATRQAIAIVPALDELKTAAQGTPNEGVTAEISLLSHESLDLYNKYKDRSIATGITKEEKDAAAVTFSRYGKAKSDMADFVAKTDLDPTTKKALDKYIQQKTDLIALRTPLLFKCGTSLPALKAGFDKVLDTKQ